MKQWWRNYAQKFDAKPERERVMFLVGTAIVVPLLLYFVLVDGMVGKAAALSKRMAQQQAEVQALQTQVQTLTQAQADPDATNRAHRDDLSQQVAQVDETLRGFQHDLVPAQRMPALLQDVLRRQSRLQLLAMRTLPVTPLLEKPSAAAETPTAGVTTNTTTTTTSGTVFRHGVEITLQGSYPDLLDYLARLEKLPWHMFWAHATLDSSDYPRVKLTVTIYTLSLDQAWLQV